MSSNDNGAPPTAGWKPAGAAFATRPAPAAAPAPSVRPPSAPRERKPALAALGLLLVLAGVLASVYLQQRAGDRVAVVEITRRVPQGRPIGADSVAQAMVAVDPGIKYVTWAQFQAHALNGYTAETDLMPGSLLVGAMLTSAEPLPPGEQIIGLSLKEGQYPVGIETGDTVSGYYVTNKNDDKTAQQYLTDGFTTNPIVAHVTVYAVGAVNPSGALDVSLALGQQYTDDVVQAASGGNLVLVFDKHTQ